MKNVVVFGGGTGLSCILTGLKLFPIDVTAVIAVSDNGSSTGVLKEELDIPAVGDLGKVLLAMSNVDDDFVRLLRYRFRKEGSLHNHPVRNIMLAALVDLKGNLTEATKYMCELLNVNGTILPLTEEKVELVGHSEKGDYVGEVEVSQNIKNIDYLAYDHPINISDEVVRKIAEADLIILSPGSLYTSIIPHLITPVIQESLDNARAEIMYVSNLVSQPGETDGYSVSDHIHVLNQYLRNRHVDVVLTNNAEVSPDVAEIYRLREGKDVVPLDLDKIDNEGAKVLTEDLLVIDNGSIRHDELKTAYTIFSYLMNNQDVSTAQ